MRAIALDIGNRYIGIAMQDHSSNITYRYLTLDRKQQDVFLELNKICREENINTIVAGVPYHVEDGSETQQTKLTRDFLSELKNKLELALDIVEIDETLTSKEAKRTLAIEGAQATEEHAEAARILLAEYLALGR